MTKSKIGVGEDFVQLITKKHAHKVMEAYLALPQRRWYEIWLTEEEHAKLKRTFRTRVQNC